MKKLLLLSLLGTIPAFGMNTGTTAITNPTGVEQEIVANNNLINQLEIDNQKNSALIEDLQRLEESTDNHTSYIELLSLKIEQNQTKIASLKDANKQLTEQHNKKRQLESDSETEEQTSKKQKNTTSNIACKFCDTSFVVSKSTPESKARGHLKRHLLKSCTKIKVQDKKLLPEADEVSKNRYKVTCESCDTSFTAMLKISALKKLREHACIEKEIMNVWREIEQEMDTPSNHNTAAQQLLMLQKSSPSPEEQAAAILKELTKK